MLSESGVVKMTLGSLFAGIGGFERAAERCGMNAVWSAEIDSQCQSVLARQFGRHDYTLIKDVRHVSTADHVRPRIISAGWPCQGNSVAGRRAGMADERSGLWGEVVRILAEFRPKYFLGENVPGILSVNAGRDWYTVLRDLAQLGYGFAYRVLDAQWFGVAQRRRRVFIVGCLGNWRRAAEILFEPEGLPWDSAPSREARTRIADCLTAGTASGSGVNRPGRRREDDTNIVAATLNSGGNSGGFRTEPGEHIVACPVVSPALKARDYKGPSSDGDGDGAPRIAHTLRGEGFDASEDGTGRGTPIVPIAFAQNQRNEVRDLNNLAGACAAEPGMKQQTYVAYAIQERAVSENLNNGPGGSGFREEIGYTLEARHHQQAVAGNAYGVRRLTPRECERLQGFPDDWTRYGADGKEISDSARYRMCGNSVCVPNVEWIVRRLVKSLG